MRFILLFTLLGVVVNNSVAAYGDSPPEDQCIGSNLRSCCMKTLQGKDSAAEVCQKHNCAENACDNFNTGGSGWEQERKVSELHL